MTSRRGDRPVTAFTGPPRTVNGLTGPKIPFILNRPTGVYTDRRFLFKSHQVKLVSSIPNGNETLPCRLDNLVLIYQSKSNQASKMFRRHKGYINNSEYIAKEPTSTAKNLLRTQSFLGELSVPKVSQCDAFSAQTSISSVATGGIRP